MKHGDSVMILSKNTYYNNTSECTAQFMRERERGIERDHKIIV